ncbi:MAG: baseplate J/gp47 family protein, partial [Chloroflexota bacterium]|nr:baseplate J/gp47 family protein [Chloroflexota bacterium]
ARPRDLPPPAGRGAGAATFETSSGRSRGRMVGAIVAAVIAVALVVGGVAAYLLLPSATITVTPRAEQLGPVSLTVRADPAVTSPDPAGGAVPADRLTFDLAANDTFTVKGKRIVETKATGTVTFRSYNTAASNTIPAGSVVSTEGGIGFRTQVTVRLGRARVILPSGIVPSYASVAIEALKPGTVGNVPANAITVVPKGEDPLVTSVRNVDATAGGTHQEIPRIEQADVEAATAQLTTRLGEDFQAMLADPGRSPAGSTVYTQTATMADPIYSVDLAALVGQEVATFELGATSTGGVTAVDRTAVAALATEVLRGRVAADHRLVDGSIDVRTDAPTVSGEVVMFPVTARAQQVVVLDAKALAAKVKGRPIFQARSILEPYGDVQIGVWPDWVTSIPTIDGRIELRVGSSGSPSPSSSSSPLPSPSSSTVP